MLPSFSQAAQTTSSTNLVRCTLFSEGEEVAGTVGIIYVSVWKVANKIAVAKIQLNDGDVATQDFTVSNSADFIPGKEIEIKAGYHSDEETIFKGIVVRHGVKIKENRASVLEIECRGKAIKMTFHCKSAYFLQSSDRDIFNQLFLEYDISANVGDTAPVHPEVVQYQSTDWDFIMTRAEANGMLVFPGDDEIVIAEPDFAQEPTLTLSYGSSIVEFEAEMDARCQYPGIKAAAWDFANQELAEATGNFSAGEQGNLSSSDLADALGSEDLTLYHSGDLDVEELQKWTDARLLRNRLAKIKGRIKIQGNAALQPGQIIQLEGVGERFNGTAFVSGVSHQIDNGAWYTNLQIGLSPKWHSETFNVNDLPAGGLLPAIHGLHTGIVSKIEGDEREGNHRIQVRMSYVAREGDVESDGIWARLATPYAGHERGLLYRPEIGDEVLLGFVNDDPRDAIILGSLHSNQNQAPIPSTDDNFEKGFYAKGKMKLTFNDDDKSILLETETGNSILLSEAEEKVEITDQNNNKITLSSAGISLESPANIELKATGDVKIEGANIENKANVQWKTQANIAELNGSANTVVKGGIVQIN